MWLYPQFLSDNYNIVAEPRNQLTSTDDAIYREGAIKKKYNYNHLSPTVFVIDFDNTLAVYDNRDELGLDTSDFPSIYSRPHLFEFLNYIRKVHKHNSLILWTLATKMYIQKMVLLLGIANYFDYILCYDDCMKSLETYKYRKSFKYITSKFPNYKGMRSVFIDDNAYINGNSYFDMIEVKPYSLDDVMEKNDSTLLNLILYIEKTYYQNDNNIPKNHAVVSQNKNGELYLSRRSDITNCDILIKGWFPKC